MINQKVPIFIGDDLLPGMLDLYLASQKQGYDLQVTLEEEIIWIEMVKSVDVSVSAQGMGSNFAEAIADFCKDYRKIFREEV